MRPTKSRSSFTRFAKFTARTTGRPATFLVALLIVVIWALTGPLFGFSDTWQLVVNTSTTIVTFLMVFLIQNTQNRDTAAIQLKLDELIRASEARNVFANLEDASDEEIEAFQHEFEQLRKPGGNATGTARVPDGERRGSE